MAEGAAAPRGRPLFPSTSTPDVDEPLVNQHAELRASFLLLYRYTDLQRQNNDLQREAAQAQEQVDAAERECEDLRAQIDAEREAAEQKYDKLARSGEDERAGARAVEKSLREQCHRVEREWKG